MIDHRIYTFIELCNIMNYRKTAVLLNMTQPAVTQHIKYLENLYGCKLFDYTNKKLTQTKKGQELEKYARSIISLSLSAQASLSQNEKITLNIGATKTIGEYSLSRMLLNLLTNPQYEENLIVDNTHNLLSRLNEFELDLLLLEGYFNKSAYTSKLIATHNFVGICAKDHPFAYKAISLEALLKEKIILREEGSGSRGILMHYLEEKGLHLDAFMHHATISSNKLIEEVVACNLGVSFVYDTIPASNTHLATFEIEGLKMTHDFNFVYLDESKADMLINLLKL